MEYLLFDSSVIDTVALMASIAPKSQNGVTFLVASKVPKKGGLFSVTFVDCYASNGFACVLHTGHLATNFGTMIAVKAIVSIKYGQPTKDFIRLLFSLGFRLLSFVSTFVDHVTYYA